jgi:predicted ribosomally synthesized peptide with SipW-like signal peptide
MGSILFAGAILAGGTGAFLADQDSSTGNTFATGVIDLKIDNESYVTNNVGAARHSSAPTSPGRSRAWQGSCSSTFLT